MDSESTNEIGNDIDEFQHTIYRILCSVTVTDYHFKEISQFYSPRFRVTMRSDATIFGVGESNDHDKISKEVPNQFYVDALNS